jgi:FtsP/CotA-like multicopper oxidase with cupredoxin domain
MELSRRSLLQLGGLGALAVGGLRLPLSTTVAASSASLLSDGLMPRPYRRHFAFPPELLPATTGEDELGRYATFVINQRPATARVLPSGQLLHGFGYNGSIPGPTLHVERGTRVVAKVRNRLPETHPMFGHEFTTSTHLHGNASLPEYDGYANDVTRPGHTKVYQWPTQWTGARTLWYHDHSVHHTAQNVYSGLVGQYHIHDANERALLPTRSAFDVPLTVSDVMFAADGNLGYDDRLHSGLWGDVILVNGVPWPVLPVQRRVYRFRMLNASVSRSYRPTLFPGGAVHMVATDGGLMPRSREVTWWRHGSAERYEFLVDFRQYAPGTRVELRNLSNDNNRDYDHTDKIMAFDVTDEPVDTTDPTWNLVPDLLADCEVMALTPDMAVKRRELRLKKSDITNRWSINDRTWEDVVASGFREVVADPDLHDVEIWSLDNRSGGWFHPVHTHLVDQKILARNGTAPFPYELGPKDVIYVGENERVDVIMRFGPHRGRYMIHCHNLPHEDHDMMVQFSVGLDPDVEDPHHPVAADPATWDDDGDEDVPPDHYPPGYEHPGDDDGDPGGDGTGDAGTGDEPGAGAIGPPTGGAAAPPAAQLPTPRPRHRGKKRGKGAKGGPKKPHKPHKPRKPRRPKRPRGRR